MKILSRLTRSRRRQRLATVALSIAIGLAAIAHACNVPVFRFALERWRPDAYRVTVFHRGPLTASDRQQLQSLAGTIEKPNNSLNIRTIDVTDLDQPTEENASDRLLLTAQASASLPWLVVQYPPYLRIEIPVWAGPLKQDTVSQLLESPVRSDLVSRLADGQTAVWVLLESGQPERDNAAAELLAAELRILEQELKLPELSSSPDDELLASTPLKIAFSILRVPRDAEDEQALAGMLVRCEPDLADRTDPIVYPVFGRGRVLLPLIGAGITPKNIHDVSEFLVGPCSCQVKEQNPGFDLLISADWEDALSQHGVQLTAAETRSPKPIGPPQLVPIPSGSSPLPPLTTAVPALPTAESAAAAAPHTNWLIAAIALAGILAIILLGTVIRPRQSA
jgi:hypothetical protein